MSAALPGCVASMTTIAVFVRFLGSLTGHAGMPSDMPFIPLQWLQRDDGLLPTKASALRTLAGRF